MAMHAAVVRYEVPGFSECWTLPEQPVPESAWHDACVELLKALLVAWLARTAREAAVYRNLAICVRSDRPKVGFDPDLCLVEPAPLKGGELESLKLWRPDHKAPALAIEVVRPNHPTKDYSVVPEKCAAAGVGELVVFDPKLVGPRTGGGPHLLQIWRRWKAKALRGYTRGTGRAFRRCSAHGGFRRRASSGCVSLAMLTDARSG